MSFRDFKLVKGDKSPIPFQKLINHLKNEDQYFNFFKDNSNIQPQIWVDKAKQLFCWNPWENEDSVHCAISHLEGRA